MHDTAKQLMKLMFREGETVCVSPNMFGYHSVPLENSMTGTVTLVSPVADRPIEYLDSSQLTLVALNPIKGFRQDANCTAYRNFLVEMDYGTNEQQLEYIHRLGLPYSAIVFSGNKSLHFLISLGQDLPSESVYRTLSEWILSIATMADQNTKNPSRCFRIPGALRDTGKQQELMEFRGHVTLGELSSWLSKYPHLKPARKDEKEVSEIPDPYRLSPWVRRQLREGIDFTKGRNATWFALSCDFFVAGYSVDNTFELLEKYFSPDRDFSRREWESTIRSAYRYIHRERVG